MRQFIVFCVLLGLFNLSGVFADERAGVHYQAPWHTLETLHFKIHYQTGHEALAERVEQIAEYHYTPMTTQLGWVPSDKTHIRIVDYFDYSNGYASPLPYDQITMIASPPDTMNQIEDYGDWLEMLFVHEFTHTLHIGQSHGAPAVLQKIFGRTLFSFPHIFSPDFIPEGLAIYQETDQKAGVGRGQSALYEMMMRMEVLEGFKPITQVNMDGHSWPYGKSYLYGAFFFNYLVEEYGYEPVQRFIYVYSRGLLPYLLDRAARRAFGKSFSELWLAYRFEMVAHFREQITMLEQEGLVTGEALTKGMITNSHAKYGADGLYYIRTQASSHAALMRLDAKGKTVELQRLTAPGFIDTHWRSGVLVSQLKPTGKGEGFSDLYRYHYDGRFEQLTHRQRYRRGVWMPDGEHLVALRVIKGAPVLDLLDKTGGYIKTLWAGELGAVIGQFDISPNGLQLVASKKRDGQHWDLELFDLTSQRWEKLTDTGAIESAPVFVDAGQGVLFSADYGNKVYNLHKVDLVTEKIQQFTRVLGGAFRPDQNPVTGKITYFGYGSQGYDLYEISTPVPLERMDNEAVYGTEPLTRYTQNENATPVASNVSAYSPWETLRPRSWAPFLVSSPAITEIGLSTYGEDAVKKHSYVVDVSHEFESGETSGAFQYLWDWPLSGYLSTRFSRENEYFTDGDDEDEALYRVRASDTFELSHLRAWTYSGLEWSLDYGILMEKNHDTYQRDSTVIRGRDFENALAGFRLTYDDRISYQSAFFLSEGQQIAAKFESNDVLSSDYAGNSYALTLDKRLPIGRSAVAFKVAVGYKDEETLPFRLSGSTNFFPAGGLLGQERYRLRGYPSGAEELRGDKLQLNSIEWFVPIKNVERTWGMFPVGLQRTWGSVFLDTGAAWFRGEEQTYYTSAGFELHAEPGLMGLGYLQVSLGYAHGFDEPGEDQLYLRIGADF